MGGASAGVGRSGTLAGGVDERRRREAACDVDVPCAEVVGGGQSSSFGDLCDDAASDVPVLSLRGPSGGVEQTWVGGDFERESVPEGAGLVVFVGVRSNRASTSCAVAVAASEASEGIAGCGIRSAGCLMIARCPYEMIEDGRNSLMETGSRVRIVAGHL